MALVGAYEFGLDIVYLHMDLNTNVRPVLSAPSPFFNIMNRFTIRDYSFHGTDTMSNSLKMCSRKSAVTMGRRLIGTGHKVLSAQLHNQAALAS